MISYEIVEHGKPLQKAVRETPRPQGTEVLMRVTRSGVCHSDVHIWEGYFDLGGGNEFLAILQSIWQLSRDIMNVLFAVMLVFLGILMLGFLYQSGFALRRIPLSGR